MGTLENDMSCLLESVQFLGNDKNQMVQALEHLSEMVLQGIYIYSCNVLICNKQIIVKNKLKFLNFKIINSSKTYFLDASNF